MKVTLKEKICLIILAVVFLLGFSMDAEATPYRTEKLTKHERPLAAERNIFYADVTAYCPCAKCCGKWTGKKKMKIGQVAASRSLPFGTRLKIKGKVYIVNDRLAKKFDKRVDIYYKSHKAALKAGKKRLKVEVLK